jgi:hypothetical protein
MQKQLSYNDVAQEQHQENYKTNILNSMIEEHNILI